MRSFIAGIIQVAWAVSAVESQTFVPLFNGSTLSGWHAQAVGSWQVVAGVIEGRNDVNSSQWGHLVSDSVFTNFILRYQWRLSPGGNSGLYFHSSEGGTAGMIGPQIEMDGVNNGVYTTATNPWGWVAKAALSSSTCWAIFPGLSGAKICKLTPTSLAAFWAPLNSVLQKGSPAPAWEIK